MAVERSGKAKKANCSRFWHSNVNYQHGLKMVNEIKTKISFKVKWGQKEKLLIQVKNTQEQTATFPDF